MERLDRRLRQSSGRDVVAGTRVPAGEGVKSR